MDFDQVLNKQVGICDLFNRYPRLEQKVNVPRDKVFMGENSEGGYENYSTGKIRLQAQDNNIIVHGQHEVGHAQYIFKLLL